MPPASASAPSDARPGRSTSPAGLLAEYLATLAARGAASRLPAAAARGFLSRWPGPQAWAAEPLPGRLSGGSALRPFLMFLMLAGHLRPGYDYLLARS